MEVAVRTTTRHLFSANTYRAPVRMSQPNRCECRCLDVYTHVFYVTGGYNNPPLIPGGLYPPASNSDASVLWAFGHGLSYGAAFNYSHLKVSPEAPVPTNGKISITVTVTNTGDVGAEEVAQLYVRDDIASVATPVMRLCGFERTFIAAKEHVDVEFTIDVQEHLALVNVKLERTVEPGTFTFMVGGSSDKIQATASVTVVAP
eukprot:m.1523867 g.1523867  ORF g.1523867 m.1523867 type:complete len:203 (+) comp25232_c0_seq31:388-996(+)